MNPNQDNIHAQLASFGGRLKELRLQRGWTLEQLARQSVLSKAFISRLENGDRQASIAAVLTLARVFGVSLSSMFETEYLTDPCVIVRSAEVAPQSSNGLTYVPLSHSDRFFNLQPLRISVSPERKGQDHYQHHGEEWIYVLSGQLRLSLAGQCYDLEAGDAAHFDSRLPHRLLARGKVEAEVLLVGCPLTDSRNTQGALTNQRRAIQLPEKSSKRSKTFSFRTKKQPNPNQITGDKK